MLSLPGRAWLEFNIRDMHHKNEIKVTAHFDHDGLWGKLYWFSFLPFHYFLFTDLLKDIDTRS
jgi:hypothetical protein